MPIRHAPAFQKYFNTCQEDDVVPSFEGFIQRHYSYIKQHAQMNNPTEKEYWFALFSQVAKKAGVAVIKGHAAKAWGDLVNKKETKSNKRSYMVANVVEELQGLKKKLAEENDDDDDIMKKYNSLRSAAIDHFQETNIKRSFVSDLNKLLIVQGIIKIDRQTDPAFVSFGRKMKLELYGPSRRLPTKLNDAIIDVLEQCRESQDYDEVEEQLNAIKLQNTGINARIVKTLLLLWDHMTIKKKQSSEMRLQSGVVAAVCNIFRLTKAHDPHGCNSILFDCDALKRCRPDFVVEVDNEESFVNVAGEIKGEKSCPERLALDVYRLGVFGLHMLWKSRMKNSLVFQAEGLKLTFFLCSRFSGICLMTEVSTLVLPSTIDEFINFSSQLNVLYNLACLYDEFVVKLESEDQDKEWKLLSYDSISQMYDLKTTLVTKATSADMSTTTTN